MLFFALPVHSCLHGGEVNDRRVWERGGGRGLLTQEEREGGVGDFFEEGKKGTGKRLLHSFRTTFSLPGYPPADHVLCVCVSMLQKKKKKKKKPKSKTKI